MTTSIALTVTGPDRVALVKALRSAADNLDGAPAASGKKTAAAKQENFDIDPEVTSDLDLDAETASVDEPEFTAKDLQAAAQKLATKKGGKERLGKIFRKFDIKSLKDLEADDYAQFMEMIVA